MNTFISSQRRKAVILSSNALFSLISQFRAFSLQSFPRRTPFPRLCHNPHSRSFSTPHRHPPGNHDIHEIISAPEVSLQNTNDSIATPVRQRNPNLDMEDVVSESDLRETPTIEEIASQIVLESRDDDCGVKNKSTRRRKDERSDVDDEKCETEQISKCQFSERHMNRTEFGPNLDLWNSWTQPKGKTGIELLDENSDENPYEKYTPEEIMKMKEEDNYKFKMQIDKPPPENDKGLRIRRQLKAKLEEISKPKHSPNEVLRENLIHELRHTFGPREGDVFELPIEEMVFADDGPPSEDPGVPPKTKKELPLPKIDKYGRAYGSGKRKRAHAQCWIKKSKGLGNIYVNHLPYTEYFHRYLHRGEVIKALHLAKQFATFDIFLFTGGGGKSGQAGACGMALARALANYYPIYHHQFKRRLLLRNLNRIVERKKYGKPKARKSYTFVKR